MLDPEVASKEERRSRRRSVPDNEFSLTAGPAYRSFLGQIHDVLRPDWYLEVGTSRGGSLKLAPGKSVAVDPRFMIPDNAILGKPACLFFQQTSDDFFANPSFQALGLRFGLAFLDGLHWFEFLLRDLMNTERHLAPGGVVLMHDTSPFNHAMTDRTQIRGAWTGDVWKVLPILRRYRPEVTITHLDLARTGLAMITGLGSGSRALDDNYEAIVNEYMPISLSDYGVSRYFQEFPLVDAAAALSGLQKPAATPKATGKAVKKRQAVS